MLKLISATVLISGTVLLISQGGSKTVPASDAGTLVSTTAAPEELGKVQWLRNLEEGQKLAVQNGKPILILFQEVPGCSNCKRYGANTLSHPLIVEAIESLFVPVCIYNNKGGKDAEALKRFDEPSWNNPVVRIVRSDYSDIILRIADFRSSLQLIRGMRTALELSGFEVPAYLNLLETEFAAREAGTATATFSMYCFWSGEGTFGAIPGVIETTPGFQHGKEVVQVVYDPNVTSLDALTAQAAPKGIKACSGNEGFRPDDTPKYYMAQTAYKNLHLTSLQACLVNSRIGARQSPDDLLSPRQLAQLKKGKK